MGRPRKGSSIRSGCSLDAGHEYDAEQVEFIKAMDRYKRDRCRPYPTCAEVLAVARSLGYRKVGPSKTE